MFIQRFLLVLLFLCSLQAYGAEDAQNGEFLKDFVYGEKDPGDYQGIHGNFFDIGAYGKIHSLDKQYAQDYTDSLIMPNWSEIYQFAGEDISAGIFCPDSVMAKHYTHLRYYFRLIAMSYLFESYKLLEANRSCRIPMEKLLKKCEPKTSWMRQLVDLAHVAPALKQSQLDKKRFLKMRETLWCEQKGEVCTERIFEKQNRWIEFCKEDEKALLQICSENDEIYGISDHSLPYWLLKRTHIVDRFDSEEEALGCMRRFSQMMKFKEKPLPVLGTIFEPGFEALPDQYSEGVIFAYGSLQEFGELEDLFVDSYQASETQIKVAKKQSKVQRKEKPIIKPKLVEVKKVPIVKRKKVEKKYSAFYQACRHREKYDLAQSSVDMLKFHYDLLLKGEKRQKAHELLSKFRQRKVLEAMKQYEKLGQKEAPVPLVFLKYLLDTKDHQGMFNIIGVLGTRFYIRNDFDADESRCRREYARFYYDRTQKSWQLQVLKEEPKKQL